MDLLTAIKISASGLAAQRTRLSVLSSNLANANTTRTEDGGGPYKRKDPIFKEVTAGSFDNALDRASKKLSSVEVSGIREDDTPGTRVFDPKHPDADEEGFVTMPNVNVMHELTDVMSASSSYEANASAIKAAKDMINAVLAISRSG